MNYYADDLELAKAYKFANWKMIVIGILKIILEHSNVLIAS